VRYAILSDVHGNHDALVAVVSVIQAAGIEQVVCLGDVVGYGPQPAECLGLLADLRATIVAGNHDLAVCGKLDFSTFNQNARIATVWTREQLSVDAQQVLGELPLVREFDGFTAVHGSLHTPALFDYVQSSYDASLTMQEMRQPLCFIGHSHVPVTFHGRPHIRYSLEPRVDVDTSSRTIVNVGSVGQPRDNDPRSCCAIYDNVAQTVDIVRVPYDIDAVARRIDSAGLPRVLGERLKIGR
jgi:diadenosine tetraphosphatase ApaH/serine/threonine PP2A family protein phosphatase